MYQKIKAKFKANPTIFYACSIVASWAGVGSLMNFRTLAINNGAAAAIIWAVFNSLACIFFGLFAEYIPTVRRIMHHRRQIDCLRHLPCVPVYASERGHDSERPV